jgi:hypothetical protein
MKEEGKHIEDLFQETFNSAEVTPPETVWSGIEHSLNETSVEQLYSETFKNAAIQPTKSVWKRISYALFFHTFFQFRFQSFNVYYAALTAIIGGAGIYMISNDAPILEVTEHPIEKVSYINTEANVSEIEERISNDSQTAEIIDTEPNVSNEILRPTIHVTQSEEKKSDTETVTLELDNIYFEGRSHICEGSIVNYSVLGVPSEYAIDWDVDNANIEAISHNTISTKWNKPGKYNVKALISYKNATAEIEYPITVAKLVEPIVKGNSSVCVGEEKMLYQIDEPVNKNIRYIWESSFNRIEMTGNKYVNIDWIESGNDTINVTRIDDRTGCKSQGVFVVEVNPKPQVDFTYAPMGNEMFKFSYTGPSERGLSYEWTIEGVSYSKKTIEHFSSTSNSSIVTLEVKDRNKCVNVVQKEVPFNKYVISIPQAITVSSNSFSEKGLLPFTNTPLREYTIEIYNAQNEKIWESSKLQNGKPSESWNGELYGNPLPSGKYFWQISAVFEDGVKWNGVMKSNGECKPEGIVQLIQQ